MIINNTNMIISNDDFDKIEKIQCILQPKLDLGGEHEELFDLYITVYNKNGNTKQLSYTATQEDKDYLDTIINLLYMMFN